MANEVVKKDNQDVAISEADALLRLALEKDLDVDKLEKLIELKNRQEERQAKQEFDFHFAEMQKDLQPIIKDSAVEDASGRIMYKYAQLGNIQKEAGNVLFKHGFSYRWEEERLEVDPPEKRITCIISGWGYEKRTYTDMPIQPATKATNNSQQRGVATTYGKRYSFCSAVGIVLEEDDDAVGFTAEQVALYAEHISAIQNASTMAELKEVYKAVWEKLEGDDNGKQLIFDQKNARKAELQEAGK